MTRRIFYGWYIVAASIGLNFYLSVVFFQGFQVFFLPILNEFGWTRALTSGAFSLRQLESGLLAPAVGFLVDRFGPRIVILVGVILGGLGMVLMSYVDSLWTFYIAFLIASLGMSGASHGVSWAVAVANWFRKLRGRALGMAMMGPVLGGPFVVIAAIIEDMLGWRVAVMMMGIGLLIVGTPLALVARSKPEDYGYLPDGATHSESETPNHLQQSLSSEDSSGATVGEAVRTLDFWVLTLVFAATFIGISGLMVHLIPLLQDLDYTSAQAATILGLVFLLSGIGRIGSGFLVDIIDFRIVTSVFIALQVAGLLTLSIINPSQVWLVSIFALLFGIGFGGTIPLRPFLIMQSFGPRAFGALQGLVQGGAIGAGVVGPVLFGWIFDTTESYDLAIYSSAMIMLGAIPFTYALRKPERSATNPW